MFEAVAKVGNKILNLNLKNNFDQRYFQLFKRQW